MYKQKLGMSVKCNDKAVADLIMLLSKIGFDAVSPEWHEEYLKVAVSAAKEKGMEL